MKNFSKQIGGAILTVAFIFGISAAAGMTAQAQYRDRDDRRWERRRDRDDRWNQSQNRDWRRERAERERLERARRDNRNYGNNGQYGNYGGYGNGSQVEVNQGYQYGLNTGASDAQRRQSYSPQRSHYWKEARSQAFRSGFEQGYAQGYQQYAGYGNGGYGNGGYGNTRSRSGSILGTIFGRP